ncbi:hypothetical protein C2U70_23805 [Bradyrhizobium guangdongense]|uniref:hypothetical protein n=1 Tax=Bradyrhizobium guangdongense TaxID=1325090 RepID=UPI00112CCDD2|nr:hypothetical protein [Bradyrhizobium guangdongense]TPQ31527.1 hypothetical protein C2U70_23805 [Bradyrhizobium guangdongense]
MQRKPDDNYPLLIGGGVIVLALFLHSIYEDLLKAAILQKLGALMGVTEAEIVGRMTEMALPSVGAIAVVWLLYKLIQSRLAQDYAEQAAPRIKFTGNATLETSEFSHDGSFGGEHSLLTVENCGSSILEKCSIKIEAVTPPNGPRQELQVSLTTEARNTPNRIGRFSLSGGERKRIPLTSLEVSRPGQSGFPVLVETTSGQLQLTYPGQHLLEISANAEIGQPERRVLRIDLDSDGRAKIEWEKKEN